MKLDSYDLGSCQYEEAARIYNELSELTDDELKKVVEFKQLPKQSIKLIVADIKKREVYYKDQIYKALDRSETVEDIIEVLKSLSWDLWKTLPYIAKYFFDWKFVKKPKHQVFGPDLNRIVQEDNPDAGVAMFLLMKFKIVEDELCYMNFST